MVSIDPGMSALERIQVLDVDRGAIAKDHDQDREADGRFRRGHGQNKEHEHLSGDVAEKMRKRDEVRVDGQQHQLDRHQQDDQILPVKKNTDDAEREQDRAKYQIMFERYHDLYDSWNRR